ncbi:hypothetical protein M3Y98_00667000 [Aphelenchoides besseyi]|nr:hypothetical protein M3Y98_00667000 [Aphelenchoides besseyi]
MTRPAAHKKQASVLLRSDSKVRMVHKSMSPASHFCSAVPEKDVWTSQMSKRDSRKEGKKQEKIDIARSHRNATRSSRPIHTMVSQTNISICTSNVKVVSSMHDFKPATHSATSPVSPELNLNSPLPQTTNNTFMFRVNPKKKANELDGFVTSLVNAPFLRFSDLSAACSSCIFAEQLKRINKYEAVFFKPYKPLLMQCEPEMKFVEKSDHSPSLSSIEYDAEYCDLCNSKMQSSNVEKPNEIAIVTRAPIESLENSKDINMTFPGGRKKFVRIDCKISDLKAKRVRVINEEKGKKSESYELYP